MDILQRRIDQNYANKKRSSSLKWSIVNGVFLLVFVYDLSCKCAGYTSLLHYVELALAVVASANLLQHAACLLRTTHSPPQPKESPRRGASPARSDADDSVLSLSLSPRWRSDSNSSPSRSPHFPHTPPSPYAPRTPPSPHSPYAPHSPTSSPRREDQLPRDEFISDQHALEDYLGQQARPRELCLGAQWARAAPGAQSAPVYQLAALDTEGASEEGGAAAGGGGAPHVWRRLNVDPQRLTQYNLNLRLWVQLTILQRVLRQLAAADAALAALGLAELRPGLVPPERLRKAARAHPAALQPLQALLPFLEPFADQRYLVQRLRALAAGGCLSEYRWRAGGPDWRPGLPTDAELVLHLVATYLDVQLPAGAAPAPTAPDPPRPFSAQHVSAAPAPPPRGPRVLAIHRVSACPPHYVLARGEETLEAGAGRSNLLHVLLLFLAAAAQSEPPALQRVHLGPAALNMLWIIGR